jgi:glc operon protein GlcG
MACIAALIFGAAKMKNPKLLLTLRVSVATGLILGVLTLPTQKAAAQFTEKKVLTLAAAQKMVAAAKAEAERQHLAGVIAVADDGGWPILVVRMDNAAYVASVELAPGKARTAALFKKPSQALKDAINHGRVAAVTAHGYIEMQRGLPIVVDNSAASAQASILRSTTYRSLKQDSPRSTVKPPETANAALRSALE